MLSYISCLLISLNIVFIWYFTFFKIHIFKFFRIIPKDIYGLNEFDAEIIVKNTFIGELFSCPICFSTHVSFIVSLIAYCLGYSTFLTVIIGTFSYPSIIYTFYSIIKFINQLEK
jgi:hypothetical protein